MNMKQRSLFLHTCKMLAAAIVIISMMAVHTFAAAEAPNDAADAKAEITLTDTSGATGPEDAASIEEAKKAVTDAVEAAKNYVKDKYTAESYNKLAEAVAKAEELKGKADATAEQLKSAADAVKEATKNLVFANVEDAKKAVADAVEAAKNYVKDKYTPESYNKLAEAIAKAEELKGSTDATAEQLKSAADAVTAAVNALEDIDKAAIIEEAKKAVADAVENAENVIKENKDKYTAESYNILVEAIAKAKEIAAKKGVTKEELAEVLVKVTTALGKLEKTDAQKAIEARDASRTALNDTIAAAKRIEKGNYTDESYKALQDAIAEAEALAASSSATKEQLDAASDKVGAAISALKEKKAALKVGDTVKYNNNTYKVTSIKNKTVAFTKAKNAKTVAVPATIRIKGVTYKVTAVNAGAFTAKKLRSVTIGKNVKKIKEKAFYGSKVTTVTLKTKLLKKSYVKNSLKSSKVKTVKVKITKKASKTNTTYVKKYKKYFTKANAGRKVTVK